VKNLKIGQDGSGHAKPENEIAILSMKYLLLKKIAGLLLPNDNSSKIQNNNHSGMPSDNNLKIPI
jgi:hypothetical protein